MRTSSFTSAIDSVIERSFCFSPISPSRGWRSSSWKACLKTFVGREGPHWQGLERELERIRDRYADMSALRYARHVLSLFQRASSDLARIQGWSAEPELKAYLEPLVGTGYAEIHSATRNSRHFRPWHWLTRSFPQAFRRQIWGWHAAVGITIAVG